MSLTWYDPDEIKAEALGLQRQPEFDPEPEEDDTETNASAAVAAAVARTNEIAAIVADEITNHPEDIQ